MKAIKQTALSAVAALLTAIMPWSGATAAGKEPMFKHIQLETDYADWGRNKREVTWEGFGWYGGDMEKVWVKTEGEWGDGDLEEAEVQLLYSRNVARFWDFQAGVRHDFRHDPTNYLVGAFNGLAPYFFEVDASVFLSDEGDVSFRGEAEYELLLTQKLILAPYAEANVFAQDVSEQDVGAGLSSLDAGIKLRYEIEREFAPYVDFNYVGLFGDTKSIAESNGTDANDFTIRLGLRFWLN
ncbi:MAG: copper resistance protein B [Parvibaculaceae bacterium]